MKNPIVRLVWLAIGIGSTVIAQEAEKVTLRFISFPKNAQSATGRTCHRRQQNHGGQNPDQHNRATIQIMSKLTVTFGDTVGKRFPLDSETVAM